MVKLRIAIFVIVTIAVTAFSANFQLPGEQTRSGSLEQERISQQTRDALQDLRIETLQQMAVQTAVIASEAKDKLTWMFGAVVGFGALMTFLQVYQIRKK